jgi:hypothetical protein
VVAFLFDKTKVCETSACPVHVVSAGATLPRVLGANVNLSNVDFKGRDLSNHDLSGANLSGANLTGNLFSFLFFSILAYGIPNAVTCCSQPLRPSLNLTPTQSRPYLHNSMPNSCTRRLGYLRICRLMYTAVSYLRICYLFLCLLCGCIFV